MNLTPKQLRILQLIRDYRVAHGYSPTMQELADELGISKVTVFEHVEALIKKGALHREPNKARSLSIREDTIVPDESQPLRFPLVGRIAAGAPIEAVEVNDTMAVPEELVRGKKVFMLKVKGNSMIDEQILDGDLILVQSRSNAENGETVVALVDGEATVKKYYREDGGQIRLQPANDRLEPIWVSEDHLEVRGVVVAVIRKY